MKQTCFDINTQSLLDEVSQLKRILSTTSGCVGREVLLNKIGKLQTAIDIRQNDLLNQQRMRTDTFAPRRAGGYVSIRGINTGGKVGKHYSS